MGGIALEKEKTSVPVLKADYFDQFVCTASDCPQICCQGWKISVEKETYEKYRRLEQQENVSITEHLKPADGFNKGAYVIQLDEKGYCPFLTENRLCGLQVKYGADVLSTVCLKYPRIYNFVDDAVECSLTLSCHEAARIILNRREGISFNLTEEEVDDYRTSPFSENWKTKHSIRDKGHYFWDIRMASIQLLQNRSMPLSDRIFFVGMMCQKVQELFDKVRHREIKSTVEKFVESVESGAYTGFTSQLPKKYDALVEAVNSIYELQSKETTKGFMELVQRLYAPDNFLSESVLKKYEEFTNIWNSEPCSYMLENFMVNEYFKEVFPNFGEDMLRDPVIFLASVYLRIKVGGFISYMITGKMDGDSLFGILHNFAKEYLHNFQRIEFLRSSVRFSDFNSLGALYTLML